ncbi:uncharacterized protein UV8b_05749 [Ustilaginoidea virens]|uniref:Meiotically up-regulated protein n=1 Tax=Ustilaginoidea virens TaxID=1159556 RepID=A0A8E5HTZ6_USTVR|nr:uncharacterized protein UV8b_05749 [Ustilaginoidea virens]QUC21506.1 hypothetical protein UV8b_05749 [Ustilaginoidea virens]
MPPPMDDHEDLRRYQAPYSARRPVPTISRYREEKAARQAESLKTDPHDDATLAQPDAGQQAGGNGPDSSETRAEERPSDCGAQDDDVDDDDDVHGRGEETAAAPPEAFEDTSQVDPTSTDIKQRRRDLKARKKERAERLVTDPVTHLPVTIQDYTDEALKETVFSHPAFKADKRTAAATSIRQHADDNAEAWRPSTAEATPLDLPASRSWAGVRQYTGRKIGSIFQDEIWDAHRRQLAKDAGGRKTETTIWLNSLLGAVWPLVNPDLFASLSDTLEDVMQASLPKLVRMVSVEDIGQGSEPVRILGIQWLPTAAASKSVTADGKLMSRKDPASLAKTPTSATTTTTTTTTPPPPGDGDSASVSKLDRVVEGMEGEEGDFVNMEVAFAYRARSSSRSLRDRTKDMHLYLAFYLPGNIKIPVWVDLLGIIGTVRMRLQLCPDPPFFSLCTASFMGQPKVDVRCVSLSRRGLNIMDLPLISNFVQSAIDAAVAEYVAPKSLTLDLKDMLAGDDFKKDTVSVGALMVRIKRGYDFKMGDSAIPLLRSGSSDPYVSVGWAKFGKVLWSTRILRTEMEPCWDETCFVLVTPEEVNVDERLRIQLWDSDRFTADDDLGRIEVGLEELMRSKESRGRMRDRTDGFRALKAGDGMPGTLEWAVGYFPKTRIQQCQFDRQTHDPKVRSMDQLKNKVDEACERKLREFMVKGDVKARDEEELQQQIIQEMKAETDAMIISAPPPDDYPSGLLSIQIHNVTGLGVERLNKRQQDDGYDDEESDEEEQGDGLPSSYCTVIVNHSKTFRTRTKPQNSKPFFNAGCERFVRDWRECEVFVSVRDARLHEDDPLLGIVHLALADVFRDRSQVMGFYPLSGGIGRGRIRLSLVWRSVRLRAPRNLLGWQYGTVDVHPTAVSPDCPSELQSCKLKLKTDICVGKLYPAHPGGGGEWTAKKEQSLHLAVKKRYSSCLAIEFRDKGLLGGKVAAFCVFWLMNIGDEEEQHLQLPIWRGNYQKATANCTDACGERVGTLQVRVTFWAGMGRAHSRWASRNPHTRDVVEVIDACRDALGQVDKEAGTVDEEASSDSDSSDEGQDVPDGSAGHQQNLLDQLRDYKKRDKALHRQHRGLMQWKIPRTARWMKHRIGKVEESVSGYFDHHNKQPGIETEV